MDAAHDFQCPLRERLSAHDAGADARRFEPVDSFARDGGVDGYHAVERRVEHDVGHQVDRLVREVGRDFQQDGAVLVLPAAEFEERFQNLRDVFARLVRCCLLPRIAGDVDREIVGVLVEVAEAFEVVGRRLVAGRGRVLADIAADDRLSARLSQVRHGAVETVAANAYAVEQRAGRVEPEDARLGIARLTLGGDASHLDESETHGRQFAVDVAVTVESGGHSYGILETDAEDFAFERRVFRRIEFVQQPPSAGYLAEQRKGCRHDVMGLFGRQGEEQGFDEFAVQHVPMN